jgi:hypothetical protein
MNRSVFSERDHPFRQWPNCLGLGQRGLDTLVFDQGANLIRQQRFSVFSRAPKLDGLLLMSHNAANVILDPTFILRPPVR